LLEVNQRSTHAIDTSHSGSEDSTIKIWNLDSGDCVHTLNGHKYGVWSLQFDERMLVSGAEGTVETPVAVWPGGVLDIKIVQIKQSRYGT